MLKIIPAGNFIDNIDLISRITDKKIYGTGTKKRR